MDELRLSPWHLRYFYDAARLQSLSKAADSNRITRPAISKAIRTLENILGVELLIHQRRTFELTSSGRILFEKIPTFLESLTALKEQVTGTGHTPNGVLRVGTSHSLALALFPKLVKSMSDKYPDLRISLQLGRTDLLRNWISERVIDVALTLDDLKLTEFRTFKVKRGNFILLGGGKLSSRQIMTTFDRPEVRALRTWYKEQFHSEIDHIEVDSWEVLARYAKVGLGIALVPDFVLDENSKQYRNVRVDFSFPYEMVLFNRRGASSAAANALFSELKQLFSN